MEEGGGKRKKAAGGADEKAKYDDALGAEDVHHAADARARENRGDVLGADDQPREDGAVTEPQVDVNREDGEQDADGEVADEGEGDGWKNFGYGAAGKLSGTPNGGSFRKRSSGGRDDVGHRQESNP